MRLFTTGSDEELSADLTLDLWSLNSLLNSTEVFHEIALNDSGAKSDHVEGFDRSHHFSLLLAASTTVFCICANLLTILVLIRFSPLKSISTMYILSLSLADCLIGCLVMPAMFLNEYTTNFGELHSFSLGPIWLCKSWQFMDIFLSTVSLYSICAIALDRVWNLEKPLRVFKRSHRRAKRLVICVWLFPALIWSFVYFFVTDQLTSEKCFPSRDVAFRVYLIAIPVLYIPAFTLIASFLRISLVVRRHLKFLREHSSVSQNGTQGNTTNHNNSNCSIMTQQNLCQQTRSPRITPKFPSQNDFSPPFNSLNRMNSAYRIERMNGFRKESRPRILIGSCTDSSSNINLETDRPDDEEFGCLEVHQTEKNSIISRLSSTDESTSSVSVRPNAIVTSSLKKECLLRKLSATLQRQGSSRFSVVAIPGNLAELLQREGIVQQVKAAKPITMILFCFLTCWFPFLITWPMKVFCSADVNAACISDETYRLSIWLNYLCSTFNPVLYALSNPKVRAAIKECHCITQWRRKKSNVVFV